MSYFVSTLLENLYIFIPTLLVIYILFIIYRRLSFINSISWVPNPPAYPILGNAINLLGTAEDFFNFLQECRKKYKGYYKLWVGPMPIIFIQHADIVQQVLRCNKNITKSEDYIFLRPYLGEGLLVSTGNKWHTRRKLLTPSFHLEILENFTTPMIEEAKIIVKKLEKYSTDGQIFDVLPLIKLCALDVMMATSLGQRINAQDQPESEYVKAIEMMSHINMKRTRSALLRPQLLFNLSSYKSKQDYAANIIHTFSRKVIKEKRMLRQKEANDTILPSEAIQTKRKKRLALLEMMLEMQEKGENINDDDIQEEVDTFVFEGHDTTSSAVSFALFLLGHEPEMQDLIVQELNSVAPNFLKNGISLKELNQLEYLERCIKETLRLYPSALIIARQITSDIATNFGNIPAGAQIAIDFFALHRDENFFENPEKFDPDRFINFNSENRHPYAYVPFSAGLRNCIGQKFAIMEIKILVASILKNYKIKSINKPEELQLIANLIISTTSGIKIKIEKRS